MSRGYFKRMLKPLQKIMSNNVALNSFHKFFTNMSSYNLQKKCFLCQVFGLGDVPQYIRTLVKKVVPADPLIEDPGSMPEHLVFRVFQEHVLENYFSDFSKNTIFPENLDDSWDSSSSNNLNNTSINLSDISDIKPGIAYKENVSCNGLDAESKRLMTIMKKNIWLHKNIPHYDWINFDGANPEICNYIEETSDVGDSEERLKQWFQVFYNSPNPSQLPYVLALSRPLKLENNETTMEEKPIILHLAKYFPEMLMSLMIIYKKQFEKVFQNNDKYTDRYGNNILLIATMWNDSLAKFFCRMFPEEMKEMLGASDIDGWNPLMCSVYRSSQDLSVSLIQTFPQTVATMLSKCNKHGDSTFSIMCEKSPALAQTCMLLFPEEVKHSIYKPNKAGVTPFSISIKNTPFFIKQFGSRYFTFGTTEENTNWGGMYKSLPLPDNESETAISTETANYNENKNLKENQKLTTKNKAKLKQLLEKVNFYQKYINKANALTNNNPSTGNCVGTVGTVGASSDTSMWDEDVDRGNNLGWGYKNSGWSNNGIINTDGTWHGGAYVIPGEADGENIKAGEDYSRQENLSVKTQDNSLSKKINVTNNIKNILDTIGKGDFQNLQHFKYVFQQMRRIWNWDRKFFRNGIRKSKNLIENSFSITQDCTVYSLLFNYDFDRQGEDESNSGRGDKLSIYTANSIGNKKSNLDDVKKFSSIVCKKYFVDYLRNMVREKYHCTFFSTAEMMVFCFPEEVALAMMELNKARETPSIMACNDTPDLAMILASLYPEQFKNNIYIPTLLNETIFSVGNKKCNILVNKIMDVFYEDMRTIVNISNSVVDPQFPFKEVRIPALQTQTNVSARTLPQTTGNTAVNTAANTQYGPTYTITTSVPCGTLTRILDTPFNTACLYNVSFAFEILNKFASDLEWTNPATKWAFSELLWKCFSREGVTISPGNTTYKQEQKITVDMFPWESIPAQVLTEVLAYPGSEKEVIKKMVLEYLMDNTAGTTFHTIQNMPPI